MPSVRRPFVVKRLHPRVPKRHREVLNDRLQSIITSTAIERLDIKQWQDWYHHDRVISDQPTTTAEQRPSTTTEQQPSTATQAATTTS